MLLLSIDQSIAQSGWALLELKSGETTPIVRLSGIVPTKYNPKEKDNAGRLMHIYDTFDEIVLSTFPEYMVLERFFSKNYQGTLAVAEVRGVLKLLSKRYNIHYMEFPPQTVRKGLFGDGRLDKEEVAKRISALVPGIRVDATLDETDAIAMGTYAIKSITEATKASTTTIHANPTAKGTKEDREGGDTTSSTANTSTSATSPAGSKRRGRKRAGVAKEETKGV